VAARYGGVVLGAYAGERLRGFLFALLARRKGRLIHWSHLMAVEPRWRDQGLGFQMKLAHRRLALRQGIKSICWTFDPLESRNAALNLWRLGARVEEYVPDCYGRFPSLIEKRLSSDRFVVHWRIATSAVAQRLRQGPAGALDLSLPQANETGLDAEGFLENVCLRLALRTPRLLIEIPPDTDRMRERALKLARRWRLEARRLFQHYLAHGYRVRAFFPPGEATSGRCFYLCVRAGSKS
jgi:predicted GNAT superfamily acetyltransferase